MHDESMAEGGNVSYQGPRMPRESGGGDQNLSGALQGGRCVGAPSPSSKDQRVVAIGWSRRLLRNVSEGQGNAFSHVALKGFRNLDNFNQMIGTAVTYSAWSRAD